MRVFGEKSGWERPNWFEPNADDPRFGGREALEALRPRGWAGQHWSPAIAAEALATREAAALFDETSFAKLEVIGPGACAFLQRVAGNDIDRPVGSIVYTQLLDRRGGIQADLTVTRLARRPVPARDRDRVRQPRRGLAAVEPARRRLGRDPRRDLVARVCFGLWGPRARDILAPLTRDDLSDAGFPYLTAREISVGSVPVLALRVTYVGELGWELYAPTEYGRALWATLWAAGREHGMVAGGYRAIDALRLEKGYRVWSSDITPDETPYEAGLGFAVALDKAEPALARDALVAAKAGRSAQAAALPRARRPARRLPRQRAGPGRRRDRRAGDERWPRLRGRALDRLRLPAARRRAIGTRGEVEVFGRWVGFEVVREPLYDPDNARIRS